MNTESYRELTVLEELSSNPSLTQRSLSQKLQVALGLTNLMIRRLVSKGYVKIVNVQRNRIRYLLTPQGISEKTRLSYEYLEYSLHLYRRVRDVLKESLSRVARQGGRQIVLVGTGEVAEIAYLTVNELGLSLVGIADGETGQATFLGHPVMRLEALSGVTFDCAVVSSFSRDLESLRRQLEEVGVAAEKLIFIERNGPQIRAILPAFEEVAP